MAVGEEIKEASKEISEEQLKKLEEMASKLKEPIILHSPLKHQAGNVVITELTDAERDQMNFTFIARSCNLLENTLITMNDILLLMNALCKKLGVDADKVVNNCIVEFGDKKDKKDKE